MSNSENSAEIRIDLKRMQLVLSLIVAVVALAIPAINVLFELRQLKNEVSELRTMVKHDHEVLMRLDARFAPTTRTTASNP